MINKPKIWYDCMYVMKKDGHPDLIEDLIVVGGHAILVDNLTDEQKEILITKIFGSLQMIEDKYLLVSAECDLLKR